LDVPITVKTVRVRKGGGVNVIYELEVVGSDGTGKEIVSSAKVFGDVYNQSWDDF